MYLPVPKFMLSSLVLFIFGCKNDTIVDPPPTALSSGQDYGSYDISNYLPVQLGNQWEYYNKTPAELAYTVRSIQDTVRRSSTFLLFGYSEDVKVANPPSTKPTSGYFSYHGGTIYSASIYSVGPAPSPLVPLLASPIKAGHRWNVDSDTFQIVSVSPGYFHNSIIDTVAVVRHWGISQIYVDTTWFGRNIGILRKVMISVDSEVTTKQLQSYTISE